jgi:hypothetical protein
MTRNGISSQRPASLSALHPVALLVAAALTCPSTQSYAEEYAGASRSSELVKARQTAVDLEKTFWACDYAATTRQISSGESAICSQNYEDFKKIKFGGDFQAFLNGGSRKRWPSIRRSQRLLVQSELQKRIRSLRDNDRAARAAPAAKLRDAARAIA